MVFEFVETHFFAAKRDQFFANDDEYRQFQSALLDNPRKGAVIRNAGGIRKVRWREVTRGKGARGGLRIIYLYVEEAQNLLLLTMYDKDKADDLTEHQRRQWAELATQYKSELARKTKKGTT